MKKENVRAARKAAVRINWPTMLSFTIGGQDRKWTDCFVGIHQMDDLPEIYILLYHENEKENYCYYFYLMLLGL